MTRKMSLSHLIFTEILFRSMIELTLRAPMAEPKNGECTLEWTHPDQVMRLHRLKLKKRALQARMNKTNRSHTGTSNGQHVGNSSGLNSIDIVSQRLTQKRKNPFAINDANKKQKDVPTAGQLEVSSDNTLFELLKINVEPAERTSADSSLDNSLTFANVLAKLESTTGQTPDANVPKGSNYVPIDWTLKTKMRFMSLKPFPWNGKLKTSEEASGTTGFVRCLDIGEKETTLDTSLNARLISFMDSVALLLCFFFLSFFFFKRLSLN